MSRDREHAERARLARDAQPTRRKLVPELVVPEILREATGQPEPARVACRQSLDVAERVERAPERRHTGRVALGEPRRQAVEEQVDRAWRLRGRRRGLSGLGRLADVRLAAEAAGVHRRRHRLEMGLASQRGVERLEAPGGSEQQRRRVAAARAGEHDLRAQPLQPRALELVERGELGGRQQLERRVRRRQRRTSPARRPAPASPRRAGSGVSSAARVRNAAAAAAPPRACARSAERSSSSATASSGPAAACARCQARRSGSVSGSVASASARCTSWRS